MTIPKNVDMLKPVSDEIFNEMTKDYPPAVKANKRAGLDFLNSVMQLDAINALSSLSKMRKTIDGAIQNISDIALVQLLSKTPADPNLPIGEVMNNIVAEHEAKLTPKSKAEHESRNFGEAVAAPGIN